MTSQAGTLAIHQAEALAAAGETRGAIDLLAAQNRQARDTAVELALVGLRRDGPATLVSPPSVAPAPILATPPTGEVFEVDAVDLDVAAVREGFAQSGCVLVRGLVPPERVALLVAGIDASLAALDVAAENPALVDASWYSPGSMPDRNAGGLSLSEADHRLFLRQRGGMWTVDSPRMLFELLELVDDVGVGAVMTEFLGERPLLSALKCTMRRVPPDQVPHGGWHQDGAFLGEQVGAFNIWLALTGCGVDAPGLDVVPKRVGRVMASDDDSPFDWSLSERAVSEEAGAMPILRPVFESGDALLFDHLLVHRTALSPTMTRTRYAIESWFFAPSAYPVGQLPILY
jgi:hypothetical protein